MLSHQEYAINGFNSSSSLFETCFKCCINYRLQLTAYVKIRDVSPPSNDFAVDILLSDWHIDINIVNKKAKKMSR